jgi:hypothetical protein
MSTVQDSINRGNRYPLLFSATLALLAGAILAVVLLPMSDMKKAMAGIASPEPKQRHIAWMWLAEPAPGGQRPRLIVLLDAAPDTLETALRNADDGAQRDAAVAMLEIDGVDLAELPGLLRSSMINALERGTADEQRLARRLSGPSLQAAPDDVTMQP